jgi:N utilization substance protein B
VAINRRKARELALQILYQIELTQQPANEVLLLFSSYLYPQKGLEDFTRRLVYGVKEHQQKIDQVLRQYSENWSLERISAVDRNILRIGIFELLFCPDIPPKVSINEAIELGKKFGTEKSAAFINGILDKIAHIKKKPMERNS